MLACISPVGRFIGFLIENTDPGCISGYCLANMCLRHSLYNYAIGENYVLFLRLDTTDSRTVTEVGISYGKRSEALVAQDFINVFRTQW